MRGKVISLFSGLYSLRITPAYAGKRYANGGASTPGGDHPRVCGEKYGQQSESQSQGGSPPRMRGKVDDIETGDLINGITPAYAGKSLRKHP